mmetsp:Transcript_20909/g.30279  ORF Transcript_20909/g.30279 Transcript_20909/m.30279 type:complete len:453 (-) Transcript_20909:103-1461(-)
MVRAFFKQVWSSKSFQGWASFSGTQKALPITFGGCNPVKNGIRIRHNATTAENVGPKVGLIPTKVAQGDRAVGYWLLGTGTMVAGMVAVGGITRLTRSGLSMTDWKIQGSMPPQTREEWMVEFERYKTFPEWQQRKGMTLDEFKFIYFWEWGHRMLGRVLGLVYAGPLLYFAARGRLAPHLKPKLALLLGLGGTQGLIGWWMVRSGLEGVDPGTRKEIRVSPYRLATHLGMAFTTGTLLLWTGLEALHPPEAVKKVGEKVGASIQAAAAAGVQKQEVVAVLKKLRARGMATLGLAGVTALSGAFVAGNDAGRAFNSWPKMGDHWVPPEILAMETWWRNFFENTATVQFDHRMLAYSTAAAVASCLMAARRGNVWPLLPRQARVSVQAMSGMVVVQIGLGISTLLTYVPTHLAVTHQAGSLTLLGLTTWFLSSMRFVPRTQMYLKTVKNAVKA